MCRGTRDGQINKIMYLLQLPELLGIRFGVEHVKRRAQLGENICSADHIGILKWWLMKHNSPHAVIEIRNDINARNKSNSVHSILSIVRCQSSLN